MEGEVIIPSALPGVSSAYVLARSNIQLFLLSKSASRLEEDHSIRSIKKR